MSAPAEVEVGLTVVDDFLSTQECHRIESELEFTWWRPSTVVNTSATGEIVSFRSSRRNSLSADQEYFPEPLQDLLAQVEGRLVAATGVVPAHLEQWQAIRYDLGGHFDVHHDAGLFGSEPAGERRTTILVYLHTPDRGGGTYFPYLERTIESRRGRLVHWTNLTVDGQIDQRMRHRAMALAAGRKTVLTVWERQRPTPARRINTTAKGDR